MAEDYKTDGIFHYCLQFCKPYQNRKRISKGQISERKHTAAHMPDNPQIIGAYGCALHGINGSARNNEIKLSNMEDNNGR